MILDDGCGTRPRGAVNLDLSIKKTIHRRGRTLNTKNIPNFILGDALHLPFRDKSFDKAISSHTIEHTSNPFLFIREMKRVAREIEVIAPLGYCNEWLSWCPKYYSGHKWFLLPNWYRNQGLKTRVRIRIHQPSMRGKPIPLIHFPIFEVIAHS